MLDRLVPPTVACAETREDLVETALFPAERAALGRAVERRRREFVTGRACARQALVRLGVRAGEIPAGPRGEPIWPAGVVGSITHCAGYRACAVASAADVRGLGIDAEPDLPLRPDVLAEVAQPAELDSARGAGADPGRLVFCAKEAVYKAWYPLTERWLDFGDAEVAVDPGAATFRAELRVAAPDGLAAFDGRFAVAGGIVCAVVVVPAVATL